MAPLSESVSYKHMDETETTSQDDNVDRYSQQWRFLLLFANCAAASVILCLSPLYNLALEPSQLYESQSSHLTMNRSTSNLRLSSYWGFDRSTRLDSEISLDEQEDRAIRDAIIRRFEPSMPTLMSLYGAVSQERNQSLMVICTPKFGHCDGLIGSVVCNLQWS